MKKDIKVKVSNTLYEIEALIISDNCVTLSCDLTDTIKEKGGQLVEKSKQA
jgi:hypothetical protein